MVEEEPVNVETRDAGEQQYEAEFVPVESCSDDDNTQDAGLLYDKVLEQEIEEMFLDLPEHEAAVEPETIPETGTSTVEKPESPQHLKPAEQIHIIVDEEEEADMPTIISSRVNEIYGSQRTESSTIPPSAPQSVKPDHVQPESSKRKTPAEIARSFVVTPERQHKLIITPFIEENYRFFQKRGKVVALEPAKMLGLKDSDKEQWSKYVSLMLSKQNESPSV